MNKIMSAVSDWWEERKAAMEDRAEEIVVPPTDNGFDRVGALIAGIQQRLRVPGRPRARSEQL